MTTITTTIGTTTIDTARGVDVFRGSKLVRRFEGADCYEQARAFVRAQVRGRGLVLRFYAA